MLGNRQTLATTLAITPLFGVFTSYLASSEIIVADVFGMEQFARFRGLRRRAGGGDAGQRPRGRQGGGGVGW